MLSLLGNESAPGTAGIVWETGGCPVPRPLPLPQSPQVPSRPAGTVAQAEDEVAFGQMRRELAAVGDGTARLCQMRPILNSCRTVVIPGRYDPTTGQHGAPVGGISCKYACEPLY